MTDAKPTEVDALRREAERVGDRNDTLYWRLLDRANAVELIEALTKKAASIRDGINAADDDGSPGERTTSADRN